MGDYKEFRLFHDYYLHDYFKDLKGVSLTEVWEDGMENKVKVYSPKKPDELIDWEKAYRGRLKKIKSLLSWIPKSDAVVIVTSEHGEAVG